ncbi:MAG TPA: 30S ribosomal protein S20 [Candidatus Saccharimonadales bacterium]|nr:30S ribosomal protein S20 [Candidatus Saccharimonadales bacterium]
MPIIKSAAKRVRQATKRRQQNQITKRNLKEAVKAFVAKPSAKLLSEAQSQLDTAVKKGVLNKRTAARRKSGLSKVAKDAGVKLTAKAPVKKSTATKATAKTAAKKPATKKPAAKKAPAKTVAKKSAKK